MATAKEMSKMYQALSNERRIKIIRLLEKDTLTLTEIAKKLNYPLPRTSAYASELENVGLVEKTRQDSNVFVKALVIINDKGEIKFK